MANRYRVGGTGNWNDTAKWSTTSGGAGGASVPGTADAAFFDANSGGGTCTINTAATPLSITTTGFTGTITQAATMTMTGALTHNNGTWNFAGYALSVGSLTVGASGSFNLGASVLSITSGNLSIAAGGTKNFGTSDIQFTGSTNRTLTCPTSAGSFYKLTLNVFTGAGYNVTLGSSIRVTNLLTVGRGGAGPYNCNLDFANAYDVYLRGSGTLLALNGNFINCSSPRSLVYEINAAGTTYIENSTGWQPSGGGGMTGIGVLVQLIANVTATVRWTGNSTDINNYQMESTSAGASGNLTFYSDNYNLTVYSLIRIGPELAADASAFTSYWGSSTITTQIFVRWQWNAAYHYLQSATFYIGGAIGADWSVYGPSTGAVDTAQTFDVGTSFVRCRYTGESWMAYGAHDGIASFYDLQFSAPGTTAYAYIQTNVSHNLTTADDGSSAETSVECRYNIDVANLILDATYADVYFYFYETGQNYVDSFSLSGAGSYRVRLRSRVTTNQADVVLTNSGTATRTDVQDNNLTGQYMDVTDTTNINSGNNSSHWIFSKATVKADSYRRRRT